MKKHLSAWEREPDVRIPRWLVTAKYIAFIVLGGLAIWAGIPTLTLATYDMFTTVMCVGLIAASIIGAVASSRMDWEWVEKWASLVIAAFLSTWALASIWRAISEGDIGRVTGAYAILVIAMLPAARSFGLMTRAGRK